jgi:hypothetical protein
MMSVFRCP